MLNHRQFLVKEQVAMLKLTDRYDIFHPETGEELGHAKEEPGAFLTILRLIFAKSILPTTVRIYQNGETTPLLTLSKRIALLGCRVEIRSTDGTSLGYLKSKPFSFRGGFHVFNAENTQVAEVKGDWKGWNFRMHDMSQNELGTVSKKWGGAMKEIFTTADTYVIQLNDDVDDSPAIVSLLLCAGLAIDMVFTEHQ